MDDATRVERLAERAVERAARSFTITKFQRSEDGYFHARVTPPGRKPIYVHRRYGSWMAPGIIKGSAVMKELDALVGPALAREIKVELQRKARALERAERGRNHGTDDTDADEATGAELAPGGEADV